jgi:RES domain
MPVVDKLGEPPAHWSTEPIALEIASGTTFIRLHDPVASRSNPFPVVDPAEQRAAGPFHRFDHHNPAHPERSVAYGAARLSGALAEVYGATRVIDRLATMHVGFFAPSRAVRLIDLRGQGALAIGATGELTTTPDRDLSQRWARWLYERYRWARGVTYEGRYAGCLCVAMWDRAPLVRPRLSLPLTTPWIFREVEQWADRYGFIVDR